MQQVKFFLRKKKKSRHLFKYFLCNLIYSLWHYASKIASHPFSALSPFLSYLYLKKRKTSTHSCTPCVHHVLWTMLLHQSSPLILWITKESSFAARLSYFLLPLFFDFLRCQHLVGWWSKFRPCSELASQNSIFVSRMWNSMTD